MRGQVTEDGPVSPAEFDALLTATGPLPRRFGLAVSGGPDSMALAFCLARWAASHHADCRAFIVDHALRPGSAAEAALVQTRLQTLGIETQILAWNHPPLTGKIHATARAARYGLLAEACARANVTALCLGHHRDDQAETVLMRLCKGSGIDGLSGMAPQSRYENLTFIRPFLSVAKTRLIATCQAHNIAFVSDPSNGNKKFARARIRALMPALASEGLTPDTLILLSVRAAEAEAALTAYARDLWPRAVSAEIGGSLRLNRAALQTAPRATAHRVLASALRAIAPSPHPPEYAHLSTFAEKLLSSSHAETLSLHGCLATPTPESIRLLREPGAVTDRQRFTQGTETLWDKRWRVQGWPETLAALPDAELRALGTLPHDTLDALAPRLRKLVPQGRVRATLPALWQQGRLLAVPDFAEDAPFHMQSLTACRQL